MRAAMWPFYSQQDKVDGKFLTQKDSCVKYMLYCADRLRTLGWDVTFFSPYTYLCSDRAPLGVHVYIPVDNAERRVHWDTRDIERLQGYDLLWTTHDYLPFPARVCHPNMKIVGEAGILPATKQEERMFELAWDACDIVGCNNAELQRFVKPHTKAAVWQFSYDDALAKPRGLVRDITVLFNSRCSATNYSHHEDVIASCSDLGLAVLDPTNYLRSSGRTGVSPCAPDCGEYEDILHRSKIVLGTITGGGGTHSFREAIACGACPVALDEPCFRELLTEDWPYLCTIDTLRATVKDALKHGWSGTPKLGKEVKERVAKCSYSAAWEKAYSDIRSIL